MKRTETTMLEESDIRSFRDNLFNVEQNSPERENIEISISPKVADKLIEFISIHI